MRGSCCNTSGVISSAGDMISMLCVRWRTYVIKIVENFVRYCCMISMLCVRWRTYVIKIVENFVRHCCLLK